QRDPGRQRQGRAVARQPLRGGRQGRRAARPVHQGLDHRPEQVHRARVPARGDAVVRRSDPRGPDRHARAISRRAHKVHEAAHDRHGHDAHAHGHAAAPKRTGWRRWTGPGWLRVIWMMPLIGFIGLGIVVGIRVLAGWEPYWYAPPLVTVATISFPLGFLAGL